MLTIKRAIKNMVHIDSLAIMDDEELNNTAKYLHKGLSKIRDKRKSFELQVDLCYVQREQHIRKARREAHETYMSNKNR